MARELRHTNSLIGTTLRLLTDDADNETALKTSLATLTRVLDAVHWLAISKGNPEAWLYFYEDFLSVYDNDLRKKTVELLRESLFARANGQAAHCTHPFRARGPRPPLSSRCRGTARGLG